MDKAKYSLLTSFNLKDIEHTGKYVPLWWVQLPKLLAQYHYSGKAKKAILEADQEIDFAKNAIDQFVRDLELRCPTESVPIRLFIAYHLPDLMSPQRERTLQEITDAFGALAHIESALKGYVDVLSPR
jgi:hypothetical protein